MEEYITIHTPGNIPEFINVGTSPFCCCGNRVGFSFGGFLLPQKDAKKLAEMLLKQLEGIEKTEEVQYAEYQERTRIYFQNYEKENPPPPVIDKPTLWDRIKSKW